MEGRSTHASLELSRASPLNCIEQLFLANEWTPTAAELQSSIDLFFPLLATPSAQARRAKIRSIGYGVPSDFELNFGRYLPAFGPVDDDDTRQER